MHLKYYYWYLVLRPPSILVRLASNNCISYESKYSAYSALFRRPFIAFVLVKLLKSYHCCNILRENKFKCYSYMHEVHALLTIANTIMVKCVSSNTFAFAIFKYEHIYSSKMKLMVICVLVLHFICIGKLNKNIRRWLILCVRGCACWKSASPVSFSIKCMQFKNNLHWRYPISVAH